MTQNLLSEPEAWREVARRFDRQHAEFLCCEVNELRSRGRVDSETSLRMHARVAVYMPPNQPRFATAYQDADGTTDYCRPFRLLAALWLSLEAEDELRSAPDTWETT